MYNNNPTFFLLLYQLKDYFKKALFALRILQTKIIITKMGSDGFEYDV
jgi:hypothetical protein